MAEFFAFV